MDEFGIWNSSWGIVTNIKEYNEYTTSSIWIVSSNSSSLWSLMHNNLRDDSHRIDKKKRINRRETRQQIYVCMKWDLSVKIDTDRIANIWVTDSVTTKNYRRTRMTSTRIFFIIIATLVVKSSQYVNLRPYSSIACLRSTSTTSQRVSTADDVITIRQATNNGINIYVPAYMCVYIYMHMYVCTGILIDIWIDTHRNVHTYL
jgi:hypothetical protein